MVKKEILFLIVVLVVSTFMLVKSYDYHNMAGQLPRLILFFLIITVFAQVILLIFRNKEELKDWFVINFQKVNIRLVKIISISILYVVTLNMLGFYLASGLLTLFLPPLLGYKNFKARIFATLLVLVFMFVMFEKLLGTELPKGIF